MFYSNVNFKYAGGKAASNNSEKKSDTAVTSTELTEAPVLGQTDEAAVLDETMVSTPAEETTSGKKKGRK